MNVWPFLNATRKLLTSAGVAFLCWLALTNSPLWLAFSEAAPQLEKGPEKEKGPSSALEGDRSETFTQSEAHLEPNALHHVMDDKHRWELLTTREPRYINLPHVGNFYLSKFMILELIAAGLICAVYIPLARKVQQGGVPRGASANFFEVLLTFIRDEVAKPSIGEHDADRFVPFLWTLFLFILFNNLLGMVPLGGSATASVYVTGALALVVFGYMHGSGIAKMGPKNYILSLWPHIDVPLGMGYVIKPLIFVIEWVGVIVRNAVLAVRLFANMFAGHMVLVTILIFIWMARNAHPALWGTITLSSVVGIVLLSLLELFVAFLQAYIFTFLTALFMGMALHPEH
jgi:F-type H+-transporting ATPase subunit a